MNNQDEQIKKVFGKTQKDLQLSFIHAIERYVVSIGNRLDSGIIVPIQAAHEMKSFVNGYIYGLQTVSMSLGFDFVIIEEFQSKLQQSIDLIQSDYENSLNDIGNTLSTSEAMEVFKKLLKTCRKTQVRVQGISEYTVTLSETNPHIIVLK